MKIINFNTAYGTRNMGDFIIVKTIHEEMAYLFNKNFVIELPTHTPVATFYQCFDGSSIMKACSNAKYKFIDGTNLLPKSLFRPWPNWNVNLVNCRPYQDSILIGVGKGGDYKKPSYYTKMVYARILSKKYIHSTRDEQTKRMLESLGYRAMNTGCPTLWKLTKDFCKEIPQKKSDRVIFTLTDYCKDRVRDQELINLLNKNYKAVLFWIQGSNDLEYFNSLDNTDGIELVPPNLASYEKVLERENIDYVGTRLHAGIYAMRHKIRSVILIVDNRARDMKESYNLVAIERFKIEELDSVINSSFATDIRIDEDKIKRWKAQFE